MSRTLFSARVLGALSCVLLMPRSADLFGFALLAALSSGGATALHLALHPRARKLEPVLLLIGAAFIVFVLMNASAYSVVTTS